ncbi:MAG: c-type cytochrome [Candidatus Tectimicrobiota bacterium]
MTRYLRVGRGLAWIVRGVPGVARALATYAVALLQPAGPQGPGAQGVRPRWLWRLVALLTLLAVGGFLVVAAGLVPIKASARHWPMTAWLLHFAMRRSVATHTLGLQAPPLDDPALVLRGAGHYDTGCSPCHGSPDLGPPAIVQHMTPHPPHLPAVLPGWEDTELFYLVKHGVKFTGMPAWPAQQRDDEVWAMVAFLRLLPALEGSAYRQLVHGNTRTPAATPPVQDLEAPQTIPPAVTASCARCHGVDGLGREHSAFPRLAGQHPAYLEAALHAYARRARPSGIMEPIAAALSHDSMRQLALYYSRLAAPQPSLQGSTPAIERGRAIASHGIPRQRVPACAPCHGPGAAPRQPAYPVLAGQYADYLVLQLELFQQGQRGGSPYAHLMLPVAARLTPEQRRDVALYYAALPALHEQPAP